MGRIKEVVDDTPSKRSKQLVRNPHGVCESQYSRSIILVVTVTTVSTYYRTFCMFVCPLTVFAVSNIVLELIYENKQRQKTRLVSSYYVSLFDPSVTKLVKTLFTQFLRVYYLLFLSSLLVVRRLKRLLHKYISVRPRPIDNDSQPIVVHAGEYYLFVLGGQTVGVLQEKPPS